MNMTQLKNLNNTLFCFVFINCFLVGIAVGQSPQSLESGIDNFLTSDVVRFPDILPFSIEGRESEVKRIVEEKLRTGDEEMKFMRLQRIARQLQDLDLEKKILTRALESILTKPLDGLTESVVIESFERLCTIEDLPLLQKVLNSPNVVLPAVKPSLERKILELQRIHAQSEASKEKTEKRQPKSEIRKDSDKTKTGRSRVFVLVIGVSFLLATLLIFIRRKRRGT